MRAVPPRITNSSGYTNVDIIGNEDLFPYEGYEFIPHEPRQSTRDRYVSVDFPLNTSINTIKVKPKNPIQPPKPFVDKPFPKVKSHRAKMIYETTINVRKKQIDYNQQYREYQRELREEEKENEMEQIQLAQKAIEDQEKLRYGEKQKLRENYEEQFKLHAAQKEKERELERQEVLAMKKRQQEQAKEDELKEQKKREIQKQIKDDFIKRNEMLQQMKATKHEREKEEERRIAKQAEDDDKIHEQRRIREEEIRMEKTRRREMVVEMQAKELAKQKKKIDDFQEKAESQASINEERERQRIENERKKAAEDRHRDWLRLRQENQMKNRRLVKRTFPSRIDDFDEEKYNQEQQRRQAIAYKTCQMSQAIARRKREQEEIENDIKEERANLERTTMQFNQSLKKLQESVPQELGLKVPEYRISMKITNIV